MELVRFFLPPSGLNGAAEGCSTTQRVGLMISHLIAVSTSGLPLPGLIWLDDGPEREEEGQMGECGWMGR